MKILFYKKPFNPNFSIYDRLEVAKIPQILPKGVEVCFSTNPADLQTADVVIWDIPFLKKEYTMCAKPAGQIWCGWLMESPVVHPWVNGVMNLFDITMTNRLDSDVPVPYFYHSYVEGVKTMPREKTHDIASFIGSSVNLSHRREYLDALMLRLKIDAYGYRKNSRIADRHYKTKQSISGGYKFVLAFENAIEKDWISEKFFDPFLVGSVPVYLGMPNIEEYAPGDHSFINANGKSPAELSDELMQYLNDDVFYATLFEWKTSPLKAAFLSKMEQVRKHFMLRLLDKLEERGIWSR